LKKAIWSEFCAVLFVDDFALPLAMLDSVPINEQDNLVRSLVYLCEWNGRGTDFAKAMAANEIQRAQSEVLLFKQEQAISKVFKHYSKMVGLPYLFESFARTLYELHLNLNETQVLNAELEAAKKKQKGFSEEMIIISSAEVCHKSKEMFF